MAQIQNLQLGHLFLFSAKDFQGNMVSVKRSDGLKTTYSSIIVYMVLTLNANKMIVEATINFIKGTEA